jgi:YVTN family beta-propeller protein
MKETTNNIPYIDEIAEQDENIHLDILKAQRDPDDYNVWNRLGNRFAEKEYYAEAIICFDRVIRLKADNIMAFYNRGLSLTNLGKYEEALKSYDKVLELDPDSIYARNSKGSALNYLGKYEEAVKSYDKVLELDPNNTDAWYNRGLSLTNLGKYEEALKSYDKVLAIDPNNTDALNAKGLALERLRKYDEAVKYYDKVLELDPNNTDALNAKGLALERLRKYDEAVKYYDKVLELDPNNTDAWYYKGWTLFNIGKYSEAEECYNRVYNLDQHNVPALLSLRQLYSNYTFQFDKSLQLSQKLLEIESTSERRAMLAEEYIKNGSYKKGRQYALRVLKDTPPNKIKIQSITRMLILTSYFMEGDSINRDNEVAEFIEYYKELEDFKIDEKEWSFNGLVYLIHSKDDPTTLKAKPILLDLIDLLQGKQDRNKILSSVAKNFVRTSVDLQHRLFRLKKIVIPSMLGSAFIVGIVLIFFVLPLYANTPCKTIDRSMLRIGDNPDGIAINPHTNNVYIATTDLNKNSSKIAVIDCKNNNIVRNITFANTLPPQLAVTSIDQIDETSLKKKSILQSVIDLLQKKKDIVYVSNPSSNTILAIDADNNIKKIEVGLHPFGIAVNPTTHKIYVANTGSNTVSVIDGDTDKIIRNVAEQDIRNIYIRNPTDIAVNPKTDKIYVANTGSNTVSVIDGDTDKIMKIISVGKNPSAIFVNEKTNHVYIANRGSNTVSVIDGDKTDSVIHTVSVGKQPRDLVADYDQQKNINKIYVANWLSKTISIIEGKTDSVINTISMGDVRPVSITVDPESHNLYLNALDFRYGGTGSEVNASSAPSYPKYIQVGDDPQYIAVNPTTHKIYVANTGSNTVSVIDSFAEKVVTNVRGINGHLAVNDQTNKIYVANAGSNTVSVIDGRTDNVIGNAAKVGLHPTDIAVNPKTDKIYVANTGSNTVSVIDGSSLKNIKNVTAPEEVRINQSTNMTVNPKTNKIYVSSEIRNQFFVITGNTDSLEQNTKSMQQNNSTATIFNGGPISMTFNPNNGIIYAANVYFDTIYTTNEKDFPNIRDAMNIGGFPSDIAIDTNTNFQYVVNKDYNTITIIKP